MGDTIKIKSLSGLSDTSTAIKGFADSVEAAGNETKRQFQTKTSGAQMEAIDAFLAKLNNLQEQVLTKAPEALRSYANVVSNFHSSVTGAGFQTEAWTSASGVESVKSKLTGEQVTKMDEVKRKLKSALDQATAALGVGDVNLDSIIASAESALRDEANARQQTHDTVQSAHDSFNSGLTEVIAELKRLRTLTQMAQGMSMVSPKVILNSIKNGTLTTEKMYYLDVVRNTDDALAVEVMIGEHPEDIGKVNPKKLSDGVYYVMADEMSDWVQRDKINKLDAFYSSIGQLEQATSLVFLERLTVGGQKLALSHQGVMQVEYDSNGGNTHTKTMEKLFEKEHAINQILGVNRGLYIIGYGMDKKKVGVGIYEHQKDNPKTIHFEKDENGVLKFTTTELFDVKTTYSSDFAVDAKTLNIEDAKKRMAEIDKERAKAVENFVKDVGMLATNTLTAIYAPELLLILGTVEGISSSGDLYGGVAKLNPADKTKLTSVAGAVSKLGNKYIKYVENNSKLDKEEQKEVLKIKGEILDKGAWVFKTPTGTIVSDEHYHDFGETQRARELDDKGVMTYLQKNYSEEQINQYKNNIVNTSDENISPEVKNYLLGKSDLTIDGMNRKQVEELQKGFDDLSSMEKSKKAKSEAESKFYTYLKTKYE